MNKEIKILSVAPVCVEKQHSLVDSNLSFVVKSADSPDSQNVGLLINFNVDYQSGAQAIFLRNKLYGVFRSTIWPNIYYTDIALKYIKPWRNDLRNELKKYLASACT